MSGDVQPRKRKDKKKKKDDLSIEEPRGTAAALGEGDVYMHSHHDHGTGGHWCAKIIFFSLLAVLVTLIGLIILENRGLSELEANSVESPYSNVLEGWIEESHDQDHHDEHTLELKHPDNYISYYRKKSQQNAEDDEKSKKFLDVNEATDDEEDNDPEDHNFDDDNDDHDDDDDNDDHEGDDDNDDHDDDDDDDEDNNDQDYDNDDNDDNDIMESNEELEDTKTNNMDEDHDDRDNVDEEINKDSKEEEITEGEKNNNYDEGDYNTAEELMNEDSKEEAEESNNYKAYRYNIEKEYEDYGGENFEDNDSYDFQKENSADQVFGSEYDKDATASIEEDANESVEDFDSYYKNEKNNYDEDEQEQEHDEEDEVDIEKIEKEVTDEDVDEEDVSTEIPSSNLEANNEGVSSIADASDEGDDDFLEAIDDDDDDEPPVEIITAPSGAAFDEIEEAEFEKPPDTLVEEEEYQKKQEELRREQSETSHMWLKLVVGGALLVATHAVLRRFTAPRDEPEEENDGAPLVDRRMTLVANEPIIKSTRESEQNEPPKQELHKKEIIVKAETKKNLEFATPSKTDTKTVEIKKDFIKQEEIPKEDIKDKELYSDEDEIEEDEEPEDDIPESKPKDISVHENKNVEHEPDENEDDVEIIDEELVEEELIEEEDEEEEISDVDDTDLLNRLEAKYGRLPEPERPGKQKDGGNSFEDVWPGEPSESYWRNELDRAEEELRQGAWHACERRVAEAALADSARARWLAARALDTGAERERDNRLLSRAINAYLHLLKMNDRLNDKQLIEIAQRTINRIQFRGTYLNSEPVHRLLIRRFPNDVTYRNNLTITFLMANRPDLAEEVLKDTLKLWPNDRLALAHHGFVLKNQHNKLEDAVVALQKALEGDSGPANEARFYYHLGDALLLLGRLEEAQEVHKRGAALGHFLSPSQRSLYNVPRLKSRPWWKIEDTPYFSLARALENSWREILKEGEAAKELFEKEKEGLKERGDWSQLDIFVQGRELPGRCKRAPVTCALVRSEARAAGCRRGQVKFSAMAAGTHVRAHVGPTNCRLRMHLGLSNTKDTYIRVDKEIRQWSTGKVLMFDDSFEHEVWHNGTGTRLVLIVDVWHPDLSAAERNQLPAI